MFLCYEHRKPAYSSILSSLTGNRFPGFQAALPGDTRGQIWDLLHKELQWERTTFHTSFNIWSPHLYVPQCNCCIVKRAQGDMGLCTLCTACSSQGTRWVKSFTLGLKDTEETLEELATMPIWLRDLVLTSREQTGKYLLYQVFCPPSPSQKQERWMLRKDVLSCYIWWQIKWCRKKLAQGKQNPYLIPASHSNLSSKICWWALPS